MPLVGAHGRNFDVGRFSAFRRREPRDPAAGNQDAPRKAPRVCFADVPSEVVVAKLVVREFENPGTARRREFFERFVCGSEAALHDRTNTAAVSAR